MARASTKTYLGLDRWAEIIGVNPLSFNSLYIPPVNGACSQLWQQMDWQNPNNVSREGLARAIALAESQISAWLGFHIVPDWVCEEVKQVEINRLYHEYHSGHSNVRGDALSVTARRKHVISGGVRAIELLASGSLIKFEDLDGDDYEETASVRYSCPWTEEPEPCDPQPITFDLCEIRLYYPGHGGDPAWEIKPTRITPVDGSGNSIIYFYSWQVVAEEFTRGGFRELKLDADDEAHYSTSLDIYRVYNDVSNQGSLKWISPHCTLCGGVGCSACEPVIQLACLEVRNERLGFITFIPATWDAEEEEFTRVCFSEARRPDSVTINYYSGYCAPECDCCHVMQPKLELAVAYLAAALLDRDMCDCNNTESFVNNWREDLAQSGTGVVSYQNTAKVLDNPFGTRRGAVEAWRILQTEEGLRVAQ